MGKKININNLSMHFLSDMNHQLTNYNLGTVLAIAESRKNVVHGSEYYQAKKKKVNRKRFWVSFLVFLLLLISIVDPGPNRTVN